MTRPTASPKTHQLSVRDRKLQAYIGSRHSEVDKLDRNYVNLDPQAVQISTLVVDTYSAGADYTFSFNGVEFTYTEDSDVDVDGVATAMSAFMDALGAIYGFVTTSVATDTITLTGRLPGYTFTLTATDTKLTSATGTTAADADSVEFGRALVSAGYPTGSVTDVEDSLESASLAETGAFTAQVDTWTLADPSAGNLLASVKIEGTDEIVSVAATYDTNLDTTIDALDVALNQALVDLGYDAYVVVTNTATTVIFTAAIEGVEFTSWCGSEAAAVHSVASNKAFATSLLRAWAGIALRVSDEAAALDFDNDTVGSYAANATMLVAERGEVWVENADSVSRGDQVWVDLSTGEGLFYNAAGTDRVPLPLSKAEWLKAGRSLDNETIALLRLK
jgi:hypothetical protein